MTLLWNIFILFTRVALFSWGGGPASLALMQREVVTVGWMDSAEFADAVAFGNALPGPIAPQVSAFIGYKLSGTWGAIAAVVGTVIPTTVLMMVLVVFFYNMKDSNVIKSMLTAIRPVVVGLLLWTAYDMALIVYSLRNGTVTQIFSQSWDKMLITLVTFAVLVFTKVNPVYIIISAAVFGYFIYR